MGLGPPVLGLYHQLKILGLFDGVKSVMELGSQGVWCPDRQLLKNLFAAFDRPIPPDAELDIYINNTGTGHAPSRDLHERLGFRYNCVDIDRNFGSLVLDLNFDSVPPDHRGKYDLTTNHGTTEHIFNQYNSFKLIHEFTSVGGLMLHALPFTVHLEHGFFNYQPNMFEALARYNSYKTIGIWIGPDWTLSSFVPWQPSLLDFLTLNSRTTHLLVVLQQKLHDTEFCVPIQTVYENMVPDEAAARYRLVIDGEYYSGQRFRHLTKEKIIADEVSKQLATHNTDLVAKVTTQNAELVAKVNHLEFLLAQRFDLLSTYPGPAVARDLLRRVRKRLGL